VRSRAGYWIGGALVAAGVFGAVLWFVISILALGDKVDDFQRVPIPGEATVQLEARKYVIYYESPTADEFVPAFAIDIVDAATGAPAPVAGYGSTLTYSYSGHEGSAVATVTPPTTGDYLVRTDGDPGPGTANVALGESLAGPLLRMILGAFGIGAVLCLSGVALIGVTAVRRSRLHPAPQGEPGQAPKGPLGRPRGVGFGILMFLVTFGIYSLYWVFQTQEETKRHTGEGLGGVVGLVVWLLISPVSAFVIPSEIGAMYRSAGREPPMTGWTGLWLFPGGILVVPAIVWFVLVQGALNRYWEAAEQTPAPA
jgi:hypothetical protein